MRAAAILLAVAALTALGCGERDEGTPVACLGGPDAYLAALDAAPEAVKLDGEVPISECLAENQPAGELAGVGAAMLDAVTQLNAAARERPGGAANLQLGYLLGAVQRGADRTQGIHTDLVRRLAVAARYHPEGRPPAAFLDAYREGFDAGSDRG